MKYCDNRELRRKLYMAYNTQCTHDNEQNNLDIVKRLVNLRMQLAQLLGYTDFADFVLRKRMAENSLHVYQLLDQLLEAYAPTAHKEVEEVAALARQSEGAGFKLMPWDFSYYSDKLRKIKFSLDDEELRPYFELSQVKAGVFGLATRLYGITFKETKTSRSITQMSKPTKSTTKTEVFWLCYIPTSIRGQGKVGSLDDKL